MKKKYTIFLAGLFIAFASNAQSTRYLDEVFTSVDVTADVKYAENYSVLSGSPVLTDLLMDVYEPNGDTIAERPLIILAHAGSFLPKGVNGLPLGDKEDSCMVEMCMEFAKRGYVAVSMDYRLGWNPVSTDPDERAGTIINAVYRAMQDMKTCVRYFKLSANQTAYKIDTNAICVAGSNSGGYMALAYGSLNKASELSLLKFKHSSNGMNYVNQSIVGGFDGEGGMNGINVHSNVGPSSDVQLVMNLGGAIGDTSWQEAGEVPIIAFHGVADALTPYKTSVVIVAGTGQSVVEVSGSHDLCRYATTLGNQNFMDAGFTDAYSVRAASLTNHSGLYPFIGAANGYEPWAWYDENHPDIDNNTPGATGYGSKANPYATPAKARAYIDTIMGYFCPRAFNVLGLSSASGISNIELISKSISLFPNPSNSVVQLVSDLDVNGIQVLDLNGRLILDQPNQRKRQIRIDVSNLEGGVYFVRVNTPSGIGMKKLVVN